MPLLFGDEYAESSGILIVYIWSIIFVFLSNGSWGYYLNEGLEKFSSIRLVIGAIINISLNLVFIEEYGMVGAAYATLIVIVLINIAKILLIQFTFKINPFSNKTFIALGIILLLYVLIPLIALGF